MWTFELGRAELERDRNFSQLDSNRPLLAVGMPRTLRLTAKLSF